MTISTQAAVTRLIQMDAADQLNFGDVLREGGSGVGVMARSLIAAMTLSARSPGAATRGRCFSRPASALSSAYKARASADARRSRWAVLRSAADSSPSTAALNSSRRFAGSIFYQPAWSLFLAV